MAQYLINDTTLAALGDKVREKTGETSQLSLDNVINTEVDKIYDAGKKSEYDAFWDRFQANRDNMNQSSAVFNGFYWGFSNFYPKYDIKPVGYAGYQLFYAWENKHGDSIGSLKQRLEECGVVLDTSQATNLSGAFAYSYITELPVIDCTSLTGNNTTVFGHNYSRMNTIEKLIVNENITYTNWFLNTNLENLTIEGVIGQNGFNVQWSTRMTHDSLMSIINALQDKSVDTSGTTWTVTLGAENIAKLTDEEQQIARDKGWVIE